MGTCVVNLGNEGLFKLDEPMTFNYARHDPTIQKLEQLGLKPYTMDTNAYRTEVKAEYVLVTAINHKTGPAWYCWPSNANGDHEIFYPIGAGYCYREENRARFGVPSYDDTCMCGELGKLIHENLKFTN